MYYDGNSGIYYYYDQEQGEYQFHSQVDISHYDDPSAAGSDYQGDHQGAALVYEGTETLRGASDQRDRRKKQKRTHSDEVTRNAIFFSICDISSNLSIKGQLHQLTWT